VPQRAQDSASACTRSFCDTCVAHRRAPCDKAGPTASVTANFTVNPHIFLTAQKLPNARVGQAYDVLIPYGNARGVPSFTVTGSIPPGLGVSLQGLNVRISGRPSRMAGNSSATYTFKITLTDQALCGPGPTNCSAGQTYSIAVS